MKIKTGELEGAALDWAVASACKLPAWIDEFSGSTIVLVPKDRHDPEGQRQGYFPSVNWSQGGPLIDRYKVGFSFLCDAWLATAGEDNYGSSSAESGPTHLIAAMRAIVTAELGDEVDVPEELLS